MIAFGCFWDGDGPRTHLFNTVFIVLLLVIVEGIIKSIELFGNKKYSTRSYFSHVWCCLCFLEYYFTVYLKEVYVQYAFQPEL